MPQTFLNHVLIFQFYLWQIEGFSKSKGFSLWCGQYAAGNKNLLCHEMLQVSYRLYELQVICYKGLTSPLHSHTHIDNLEPTWCNQRCSRTFGCPDQMS